jgi:hypothetical protein
MRRTLVGSAGVVAAVEVAVLVRLAGLAPVPVVQAFAVASCS